MDTQKKNIKNWKKIISKILPVILLIALFCACPILTACGKKDGGGDTNGPTRPVPPLPGSR